MVVERISVVAYLEVAAAFLDELDEHLGEVACEVVVALIRVGLVEAVD